MSPAPPTIEQLQTQGAQEQQLAQTHAQGGWAAYAADLPKDITDSGYDAIRDKYFYQNLAQPVLSMGGSLETAKEHFMAATERPKAAHPRLLTTLTSAGAALEAPISAMSPVSMSRTIQAGMEERANQAAEELRKQGGNPAPYQFAGQLLGTAPYFAEGLMGPEALGEEAALRGLPVGGRLLTEGGQEVLSKEAREALETYQKSLVAKATRVGATSLIQGSYDAVTAPDGQGAQRFMQGAAAAGALAGGIEGVGSLWGFLRARHGLDADTAKAVEVVAKGVGDPAAEALATKAALNTTDLDKTLQEYVATQKQQGEKQGQPTDTYTDEPTWNPWQPKAEVPSWSPYRNTPSGRIRIAMTGADGNTYHLGGAVGLKADDVEKINARIVEHLNAGGNIQSINGDPALINQTLNKLAELNPDAFKLDNPIRSLDPGAGTPPVTIPAKEGGEESKSAVAGRFAVSPTDIPEFDKYVQLANGNILDRGTEETKPSLEQVPFDQAASDAQIAKNADPVYGIVRGSSDVPLSLKGQTQTKELGERFAAKGGLDVLHMSDLKRYRQTADNIMQGDKAVAPRMPNPALRSWGLGGLEGMEHTPTVSGTVNDLIDNPYERPIGMGPLSTMSGESLNEFKSRIILQVIDQMREVAKNPDKKIGIITSSRDIGLIRSWIAEQSKGSNDPGDIWNIDKEHFKTAQENPGSVYRLGPDNNGKWSIRAVDMDADSQLQGGVYMIRHGETPWNKSARELQFKDTPLSRRYVGSSAMTPEGVQGQEIEFPGSSKPTIYYRDASDKATIFHENLHGHFGALGMHDDVASIMDEPMTEQLFRRGFSPEAQGFYGADPKIYREEVYVHGADAIRTNDEAKIDNFADADDGKDHWLDWMTQKTNQLLDRVAEADDSLHKRTAERRLNSVVSRATKSLEDINRLVHQTGITTDLQNGNYTVQEGSTKTLYPTREEALDALDQYTEPLNAPELVPLDRVPEGAPRFSRDITPRASGERPSITDPPSPDTGNDPRQAEGGLQLFSRFFRPFYDWVATVAQKNAWPELYETFAPLDKAQVAFNNQVRPYYQFLKGTLGTLTENRQKDFMKLFTHPDSDFVRNELKFTPQELAMMDSVKKNVLDPLSGELGLHLDDYINDILPKIHAAGDDWRQVAATNKDFMSSRLLRGSLDPDETNFSKIVAKYLEFGSWSKHIGPYVDAAEKTIQEQLPDTRPGASFKGRYQDLRAGNLYPLLQRHIDYLRGQPDFTQEIIKGAYKGAVDMINSGLQKLGMKTQLNDIPEDPLGKYSLFLYAGALAMKPATIVRDGLQLLLTTFPVAGKYTWKGMETAFGKLGDREALWSIPERYGALIERNDLRSLYDGSVDESVGSKSNAFAKAAENAANFGMRSIQLTHNGNRLVAFWGHSAQVQDALDTFRATGDKERFVRDSGLWFMSPSQQQSFLKEIPNLTKRDIPDFSYRAAKELVELSQWNLKRGANPGLYEYQLGRLFGQYGTWPLNYIEYARRLATSGDGRAQAAALTRLVLAHGAVMAAGQSVGVDTGKWTFTGPMEYEGGPLFDAVTHLTQAPNLLSGGQAGSEARENLLGVVPGVDRLLETYDIYKDITDDQPDAWKRLLGFHLMHSADYDRGLHKFLPGEDE